MSSTGPQEAERIGYGRPPRTTQSQKGRSGNPKGRPKGRGANIPYDTLLGQMVTIRQDGRERRVTAAEAFVLQLTKKGLSGDSAAARASLAAIENARAARVASGEDMPVISFQIRTFGLCCIVEDLGMAIRLHPHDKKRVRLMLKPWIVAQALARLGGRRLTPEEQRTVVASTRHTEKVAWPEWWSERSLGGAS